MFSKLQPITASNNNNSNNTCSNEAVEASKKNKKKKKTITILESPVEKRKKRLHQKKNEKVYTALLSHVSKEFLKRIQLSAILFKDGVVYHDVFHGATAVVRKIILSHDSSIFTTNDDNNNAILFSFLL